MFDQEKRKHLTGVGTYNQASPLRNVEGWESTQEENKRPKRGHKIFLTGKVKENSKSLYNY